MKVNWSGKSLNYTQDEMDVVTEVMRCADPLTQGRYLAEFEAKFSRYHGSDNCFALTNCAHALELSAVMSRLGPSDEVIIPAHTYCATAIPFGRTGAKIIWADIDPNTWVVSAKSIASKITPKTKAIVVVHLYGLMAEMDKIASLAAANNCILVEDCAQALGASFKGRKAGDFGDFACYSFHGQKNITTLGEGGMIRVKDSKFAKLIPGLRHNGHIGFSGPREDYWKPAMTNVDLDLPGVWPFNYSLGEAQCALGSKLLDRLDQINLHRCHRAARIRSELFDYPELVFQQIPNDCNHAGHLLPARYDGSKYGRHRDDLIRLMAHEYGVKLIVQYYPLYRYPLFQKMGFGKNDCPETDFFFDNMVSIPFHIWMSESDFEFVIQAMRASLDKLRKRY
jgi:perosamine synthetase